MPPQLFEDEGKNGAVEYHIIRETSATNFANTPEFKKNKFIALRRLFSKLFKSKL